MHKQSASKGQPSTQITSD
uniref:Uncharacterized protein n=1 Tax=Arundo donax TaxID=35708 RepID=A0A0A9AI76_ARUDO